MKESIWTQITIPREQFDSWVNAITKKNKKEEL